MIKRVSLLTRKAGLTREQFTRRWLEVHIVEEYRRPDIIGANKTYVVEEKVII